MLTFGMIAVGLALLAGGGELLVRGAARLATLFGISPLVIGLTVVAFGTSAPELAVSLQSLRSDAETLAVGNVVGSNIFNVLFILGASAMLAPLVVSTRVIWIEVPIVIGISFLAWGLAADRSISRVDGVILLVIVVVYTAWLLLTSREAADPADDDEPRHGAVRSTLIAAAGLALLLAGARALVEGAVTLAASLGVSNAVIGLTIVAAGTSLPEVAASIVATARGHRDLAVGNVLGSNIFNLTVILGITSVAAGTLGVPEGVLSFDVIIMVAVALACLPIFITGHTIARWEGVLFVAYYVAYVAYLVLDATEHDILPHFQDAMLYFAIPLTVVTLMVLTTRTVVRRRRAVR